MGKGNTHIPMGDLLRYNPGAAVASFPIVRTNSYGRMMISAQMNTHDRLVRNALARTDHKISNVVLAQMEYNRKMEKWKPGYNELQRKAMDDSILARLIRDAKHQCDERLDSHIKRFKKNRSKNPRYKPGWLEAYSNSKTMAVHEELLKKAKPRIDCEPPQKALQFRGFLRACKFTRGGFKRQDTSKHKAKDMTRGVKLPPMEDVPGVEELSSKEKAALQNEIENKYGMIVFESQMCGASSDDVRLLYAKSNKLEVDDHYNIQRELSRTPELSPTQPLTQTVNDSLYRNMTPEPQPQAQTPSPQPPVQEQEPAPEPEVQVATETKVVNVDL